MASFDSLPCEILFQIFRDSSSQELCRLSYSCKRLEAVAGTCLWSEIELHEKGYHESSSELSEPPPFRPNKRFYHGSERVGLQSDIEERARKLFTLLQALHTHNKERLKELVGRVKSLCTVIEPSWHPGRDGSSNFISVWNLLPYFTNLESLEIHGRPDALKWNNTPRPEISAPPLSKLRFAKLIGYIPKHVATYILRSDTMLERLELGILDAPIPSDVGIRLEDDQNRDRWEVNARSVVPRPLGDFFPDIPPSFPKLRHIYLCQPCNPHGDYFDQSDAWSISAEQACLETWRRLLSASSQTLETLVLEQRPGAGMEENEGFSEEEFLNTGISGAGNKAIVEVLGDSLIHKTAFRSLNQVYLYGFVAKSRARGRSTPETPGEWLMHGLERRGVSCEARRGKWCLFDQDTGVAPWAKWDGEGVSNIHDGYMGIRWYTLLAKV
ncbi:uncharacterized protein FTOL_03878 [Fusarium torulosum]|uniref:F-box domain-containing protein n=1 Tax=Fusarium torulosum TaxID=33205 RepID=A0AAE8M4P3_9HYPO|nr:uncharacterized protein FTOL_03878 [Fusarium torulosum]